ncbi:unnamed protein product [Prorocentrum cordatum]|uniref:ZZ-type domain-containing protein n=1 Tax=Prorocentrum cordatum TaxID=2364126 RepID=A0ABN9SLC6_9DINO|nr:unnamed protein product [Polarella glacialis]
MAPRTTALPRHGPPPREVCSSRAPPRRWQAWSPRAGPCVAALALLLCASRVAPAAAQSIDGGRSELPGMKRDMFDQYEASKRGGGAQKKGKGPPDCPKSDGMSPFTGITFASGEMYVRINGTEGQCRRLVKLGGANYSTMVNFSRTCGPAGEYKRRIAENISTISFCGGLDWAKHDGEMIEVETEDGTFEVEVTEAKYEVLLECWKRGCDCEQAKNPKMKAIFIALGVIAVGGLSYDSLKVAWAKISGAKPPKHVECKKGHRMEKVKLTRTHYCDVCGVAGTLYQCRENCNFDMCKKCYDDRKTKVKATFAAWLEKHPEEKSKKNKKDDEDQRDDREADEASKSEAESEGRSGRGEDAKSSASGDLGNAASEQGGADEGAADEGAAGEQEGTE